MAPFLLSNYFPTSEHLFRKSPLILPYYDEDRIRQSRGDEDAISFFKKRIRILSRPNRLIFKLKFKVNIYHVENLHYLFIIVDNLIAVIKIILRWKHNQGLILL